MVRMLEYALNLPNVKDSNSCVGINGLLQLYLEGACGVRIEKPQKNNPGKNQTDDKIMMEQ